MRRYAALVLSLGTMIAVTAAGIATAAGGEAPITIPLQINELLVNVGFSPKALPKGEQTPISLVASGEISNPTYATRRPFAN
jgi:hypothetical protein